MNLANHELKKAIKARLEANLPYQVYTVIPKDRSYPHILLTLNGVNEGGKVTPGQAIEVRFDVWSKRTQSKVEAEMIIDEITNTITVHNSRGGTNLLLLSGFTVNNQTYEGDQDWPNTDNMIQHKSVSIRFEITGN